MALNRIYKVVWSKTKGCYVVVSELAKRVGRNKAKAIVISSAAVAMAVIPVVTSTVGAAPNQAGTGPDNSVVWGQDTKVEKNNGVAIGKGAKSTEDSAIALGFQSKSSGNWSVAIGLQTNATNKQAVAVGSKSQATGENSIAIGNAANASNESSVALGSSTQSTNKFTTAVGGTASASQEGATALGYEARATAKNTIAIGKSAKAEQEGVLALGAQAYAKAADTIAIGNSATAKQAGDIIIGKDARSRDQGSGFSVAIGLRATAGNSASNAETNDTTTQKRKDSGSVAIGTNAYTGLNKNNTAVNSSVAIGAGAGVGYRSVGTDGKPLGVGTDADDNDTVLVKAFGGTTSTLGNYNNAGAASNPGFFSFQGVDINEGTALGRNTRAMGDQSVAIGAQSVAGMGSIVIGGNDIQAYDQKKYFKAANPTSGPANTVNDYDAPTTPGTGKDGQPITISKKYEELVGAGLDRSWRASYGQDGSTVIGMQAHSTTPLGVAIGTNSIVRKGAFGATAIGSGASVVANAEAAVAIGMGSEAQGNYAVAAGTAARAKESAVAAGYSANAEVNAVAVGNKSVSKASAVAVGDQSEATNSSVAVGQLAKAQKEADIAVGQGAVASGEQGAIAVGLGTQAQGDSSIMIGGSEITKVANQRVSYQKEKIGTDGKAVIKTEKKTEMIGGVPTERTVRSVVMETTTGSIQQAYGELTNGGSLNTATLDYSSAANKNGHGSISMGVHSLSTGDLGTAIGTGARVTKLGGVALGTGAISELQNGVAIGTGSRADSRSIGTRQTDISYDEEGNIVPFDSKKVAYTFYWAGGSNTSEGDVVSFGSPGAERQLKNVAAGRIADDSTDAINGSQLNSVTKRMSNGWAVEAEKDKTSSGVLKLNGALATKGTEVHSANGKTTTRENPGTATGNVDKIRLNDEVKIRVGDNLVLHQEDASRPVYEDPDNPDRQTGTRVTSKFTYSLNPELTGLKSAQFKNDAGDTTDINGAGVIVTPVTAGKQPVSLTTAGLNNGGNAISNVAGNLPSTKNNDATTGASNATTSQAAPTLGNAANQVNPTNAATVSDVLNAGWNLQGNNKAVDFVKPYDTVNFVNGDGTTATVESADGKTSTVKYSVNLGDGLKKDDTTNKITVSAADKSLTVGADGVKVNPGDKSLKTTDAGLTVNTADKSLEVTDAGLKVKAGDKTLTTDEKGLKVNTGEIESVTTGANPGTVKVKDGDTGKVATVDSVVNAVNSAAFTLKASANGGTRNASSGVTTDGESIKAGSTIEMIAGKNLDVKHDASGKITFATVENPSFNTMQVGGDQGPKLSKTNDGDLKVSGSNGTDPVKVTNVKSGLDTYGGNVAGTTDKNTGLVDLSKPTAGEPKVSDNTAATVGDIRNMGWIVSSNKTTGADGAVTATEYSGTVKNANEVRFVGTGSAIVSGKTDGNVRTITVKVDDQTSSNNAVTPVVYTDKDGNRVYPTGETDKDGNQIFNTKPDGKGNAVTGPVKTTVNGPKGTSAPTTLSNVEGNLVGAKTGTDAPTTSATAPTLGTGTDQVNKNNAATVGDVLNAGWNLQNNDAAKDFVKPYDTVNFVDGEGTTAVVETTTDQATSKIKYNVNTGKGLEKTTDNKITVKPGDKSLEVTDAGVAVKKADQSLEVTDDGLKVKTDNKTITTGKDGLTVNTGTVNAVEQGDKKGTVEVPTADAGKIATVDTVAKAVNNAAFTLKASANGGTRNAGSGVTADGESIKAGSTIEMIAGKNLDVKHDASGKITFATIESPSFNTIQVGGDQGPKLSKTDDGNIKVSDKDGTNPVNITNVKSNLPDTQNSDTTNTATNPSNATTSKAAPNTTNKTGDSYINPNNAATVSDVLNAGWNLQGNGSAVDFVKPYDTVNFVNGVNTTAVVSTVDGKTSNVTYNVTGLPITYTDKDGNLVSKIGDEFYKVNDKGQPLDAKGNPSTKVNKDGKPVDDAGNVINPINTTNNPVKTSLVNPAPEANKTGTTSPTTLDNVTSKLENYKADPVNGKDPAKNSLRDLTNKNVTDNTVATVGDIRNMGWIVSSDKTTGANGTTTATEYSEAVKNANEVRFVGEGSAIVSGKTDDKGVRTITVKVDNQTGINKTVTPVNYTKADGTKVYPQEVDNGDGTKTVKFFENPDGTGKEIPSTEVITSVNGPKGTTTPATLSNVKSNLPDTKNSDTANTADAPSNATKSQAAPNTTNKDGDKYINPNNAATVSDVLNVGWNLQGNGTEVDFVKPYDTVNFVNGLNTTAVVSTVDGKTSNVTYNVTGLPVTYTTEDGTPVTKIGDKYYKVNDQGQPVDGTGAPVTKFNKDGKPLDKDGHEVPDVNITDKPLKTSLVNPAPETNKTGTTSPTSLSNVKNNIPTVNDEDKTAHKADGTAIGGKNNTEAPITAGDAANLLKPIVNGAANPNFVGNNAATVSDVLNAGWNLQNNGAAKDFVKPYDTVNFVNGGNTTAVVTTNAAGTASDVTFNVTGLPVTYTTEDGSPVSKVGDKYYKVNDKGQPISDAGKPAVGINNDGKLVDENNNVIEPIDTTKPLKTALVNPTSVGDKPNTTTATQLGNVTSGLDKYGDQVNNADVPGTTDKNRGLVDLSKPANGDAPKVSDNTAATVGDLRNMGWIVSSNKTTGENGAVTTDEYSATVKNANEVKFVGEGTAVVSGKTDDKGVRTITVKVDDQTSINNAVTPVVYTDKDGKQVYPTGKTDKDGNQIFNTKPDGKGVDVTGPVKTTINGPKGTTSPTSLSNVKNNIPAVNDADKKVTNPDGTNKPDAGNVANINKAPLTAEEAADLLKPTTKDGKSNPNFVGNNAATVSDVLNAGWNLQNNGTAKDFVKPYDTVNFVNGGNTTAVVTTNAEGTVSDVTFNVTGLPVTNTITENGKEVPVVKVGNTFYPAKPDGTPDIQKGQDGNPTNGYVQADNGKVYPRDAVTITKNQDGTTTVTPNTDATPKTVNTNLVNPNVANTTDKPGNNVSTPNQLGNVANGAKTFEPVDGKVLANDGKWYPADKVSDKGTPEAGAKAVENPLAPKNATGEPLVQAKDGKWYKPSDLQPNGTPTPTAQPQDNAINNKAGLVDFSNSNPNNAATIGDLQNMGWVVSAQGNSYSDQVRNTNEVKFVGEGTASVTGKTDDKGVRTITVKVDDQVSTNNSVTPVIYTDKAGNTVYPIKDDKGNVTYHTTPDGKGENDKVVPNGDVNTSINGPKDDQGNTRPASLSNVKNNIPAVNDADKKVTNPDGTDKPDTGNVANINKAPLTAEEAADLLKPTTKDGKPNPNFVGNNAATVSDVLNAGWNLQNNGTAKDFVKSFDTVNFVNGGNTTAVVTTNAEGIASDVTFNVTGLPIATTIATPNGPVQLTKVGDNYYPVNADGTPNIQKDGDNNPTNGYVKADNGNYYPAGDVTFGKDPVTNVTTVTPKDGKQPVTFGNSLTNPNVVNTTDAPNKAVAAPTTLNNVKGNLPTVNDADKTAHDVDGAPIADKNNTAAPITAKDAANLLNPYKVDKDGNYLDANGNITTDPAQRVANPNFAGNNAATVSDVLNAGWNLTGNGAAVDLVKPYDTVNFRNGGNTTVSVTTDDNLTSHVQVNVTGLPVSNTITDPTTGKQVPVVKVGDSFYPVNPDGTPKIERGQDGNPTNGYVRANDGKLYPREDVNVTPAADPAQPPTITPKDGKTPTTVNTNLVNPNVDNTTDNPGNNVSTPNQLGNVANGAKTFDPVAADGTKLVQVGDKFYPADKVQDGALKPGTDETADAKDPVKLANDGKWYKASEVEPNGKPKDTATAVANPLAPKNATGDVLEKGNDGKWYKANELTNGKPNNGATVQQPVAKPANSEKSGLIDFTNSNPNNAATIGDLQNMGWVVSAEGNSYSDQVRNANEVKFVGEGTASVTGKTVDGVRTITVKVDDQTSTNNSVTPVNYTKADGTKVYPKMVTNPDTGKEELKFFENPDGTGNEVPKGDVITSINGPEGTTSPTTLKNVKNNIPNVNDGSKTITNPDGTEKTGDVENINKAPLTAEEAAALANPKTKDGQANPKYIGNNAATVSDVLNAGWNLQNNGAARDFVKPFDTVNFVNGVNTTAVVTTSEDGTTSNVTYNVTGLPVTYTTADGTPVSKIGDDYYTVNDKGQPIDANGKASTKVNKDGKPVDENGNIIKPIDTTANPLTSSMVNPNVKNTDAEPNKKTTAPTQLGNVTSGLQKYGDTVDGKEVPGSTKANNGLIDLSTPTDGTKPKVSDNTAATVGDLRNMGWIVSSDKTTGETDKAYTDTVKNANEVKFVGTGTAIVSGKTVNGVRTITVKVDDQVSTNNSVTPVNYTKADGTKVYPKTVTDPKTGKEEVKFFENPDGSGAEVPKGDVITSINGPEGTTSPTTLKNVKNNIPNVNDGSKTITTPDGKEKADDVENINKAPLTAEEAAALANPKTKDGQANPKYIGNNAATVSDVLNVGWNLQNNGESRDFVKPYDTVNFVNGLGTTAVVTTREGNTASDVTFNVKAANGSVTVDENGVKVTTGEMKPAVGTDNKETGAIATPADPATAKQLKETLAAAEKDLSAAREALKEAEKALAENPKDPALQQAVADKKADVAAKQTPVDAAQKAHDEAGLNKVATVQNVAEAINNAGFNLKTSADGGEKLTGTKDDGELIKPSNTVEMVAGNNLTVKQDANGKITYATKDNVTFTNVDTGTLNVGSPNTYTDGKGNTYMKVGDNYYKPADVVNGAPKPGVTPVDVTTTPVTPVSPVTMKAEAAKPATNNASDAQPSSALNVTSKDGKPTQITGVGSTLNTKTVDTTPAGTAPGATPNTTPANLVDLEGTADAPVNKNAAATVGDLQNMGWVVSAKDGNGYKDVVKNANVVDFKGGNGIEITGKTLTDGTREITVGIKEGEVTNKVTITHADGSKTDAIKIGDNYYKVGKDGKPEGYEKGKDGKPAGTPLTVDPKNDKVTNTGAGFVTGNTVANAIQESGWNVGIGSTDKDYSKDAKVYDKVNPNDDVKFANGANTNVSMVTVDAINEDGTKKATTYVKVDVNRDLKIDSVTTGGTATDKNGNNLVKVGDKYYKEGDVTVVTNPDGSTTVTPKKDAKPVPPADVIPAKDGAMIVKNADGKDVVSATVGKDGSGVFGVNGKDGKDGVSITAKDGEGAIGVNGKDGATTTIKGDTITLTDKDKNTNTSTPTTNVLKDTNGNTNTSTAANTELKDKAGNTNTSTSTTVTLADKDKNTNTSTAAGTTYKDKDDNKTVVGPKEINISDKSGENTASLTNKDLLLNAKDPNTGVDKTSHVSGDKIAFTTTDEMEKVVDKDGKPVIDPATGKQKEVVKMEKVFDKDGKPVIDPATGKQKEVVKNPGNSTEYTNEGLKVIPNSTVARDVNGNPTFLDKNGKPVMKDTDGKYKYVGQDGKPGEKYTDAVGSLKPNVVDNTRVISFGMDKPVLDKNGKPVTGPDGNPIMTEGISAGMQQMHNLAPGTKDTDAVNVSQLRGTTININNRMNRMGAQAAALAGLQSIQYDPLEPTQISAGLGYYKGSSALALGINHYKNESTMFHMGASLNGHGDETMMNASVTWKFGARADETAVKDTFRQGPISASYTLQDKVSALEAQNKIQKDQLNELRATNAAQKAENEAQREELALMKAQIAELFKRMNG